MRTKVFVLLILVLLLLGTPLSVEAGSITVIVDGATVEFEHAPFLQNGRMLVPVRELFTAMGAVVSWNDATRTVTAKRGDVEICIPLGTFLPTVDHMPVAIDAPAMQINGRIYVPLRFAVTSLGAGVQWATAENTAYINTNLAAGAAAGTKQDEDENSSTIFREEGIACWYGSKFHGRMTSSGEIYNQNLHTAAHRTLPFGTMVKVTFLQTGYSVWVRINDRGPHVAGRIIDLSRAAADAIGLTPHGLGQVALEVIMDM